MKNIIGHEVLLYCPNFSEKLIIHTDDINTHLAGITSQNGKPIAFYSPKLTPAQIHYTPTEEEVLSIVETLKEFQTILLVCRIIVYTDHKISHLRTSKQKE